MKVALADPVVMTDRLMVDMVYLELHWPQLVELVGLVDMVELVGTVG